MNTQLLISCILLLYFFTACISQTEPDREEHSRSIDQLYQQFSMAYQTKDVDLVSNLYANDALYLPGSAQKGILEGGEAIRNTFDGYLNAMAGRQRVLDISFRIVERKIDDSLAYDAGYYLIRAKANDVDEFPEGGNVGKFVTVMGLQPDGSWKFLLDGFSPAPYDVFPVGNRVYNPNVQPEN